MNSISPSNQILKVKNLSLRFYKEKYMNLSLRDYFVNFFKINQRREYFDVLKNISFSIQQGDRVGLLGLNGSGKTTLCRCVAGMYSIQSSSININGQIRPVFNSSIGILPNLTGRENAEILSHFIYPEISLKERVALLEDCYQFSELGEFLDCRFMTYSKGMQARISLSVISARPCDLLILDEVFDGADKFFQDKISKRILDIIHSSGAVLFVSHSLAQIKQACNRVLVLNDGALVFDGSVENGLEFYQDIKK